MAVETLADLGFLGDEVMPALTAALNDESIEVRRHAVDALGISLQNSADGVPALIGALADEDEFMRRGAALALSRIGEQAEEATPALAHALQRRKPLRARQGRPCAPAHRHNGKRRMRWCTSC